jgi:hypothetical protein
MFLNGTIEPCGETPPVGRLQPPQCGIPPRGPMRTVMRTVMRIVMRIIVGIVVYVLMGVRMCALSLQGQLIDCASISLQATKRRVISGNIAHYPLSASLDCRLIQLAAFCDLVSVLLKPVSKPKMNFQ